MAILPRKLKNYNIIDNGRNTVGLMDEITLPKITRRKELYQGSGMNGPVKIDLGMKEMQTEFICAEWNEPIIEEFGNCNTSGNLIRFLGYQERDNEACEIFDTIEMVMRGATEELDFGKIKSGEMNNMKLVMPLTLFKYIVNGKTLIHIDLMNMVEKIGGKDRLLLRRLAIGA